MVTEDAKKTVGLPVGLWRRKLELQRPNGKMAENDETISTPLLALKSINPCFKPKVLPKFTKCYKTREILIYYCQLISILKDIENGNRSEPLGHKAPNSSISSSVRNITRQYSWILNCGYCGISFFSLGGKEPVFFFLPIVRLDLVYLLSVFLSLLNSGKSIKLNTEIFTISSKFPNARGQNPTIVVGNRGFATRF